MFFIFDSDLIEFKKYLENTLILHRFDPYSPLYSLICDYNFKFVSLGLVFDTYPRVFNGCADSSRQTLIWDNWVWSQEVQPLKVDQRHTSIGQEPIVPTNKPI